MNSRSFFVTARATASLNLGHALSDVGDVDDAVKSLTEALDINKEIHGSIHRIVAASYNYLSYGYLQMGMVQQAKKELVNALKVMDHYSRSHPGNKQHCYFELHKRLLNRRNGLSLGHLSYLRMTNERTFFSFITTCLPLTDFLCKQSLKKIDRRGVSLQPGLDSTQLRC